MLRSRLCWGTLPLVLVLTGVASGDVVTMRSGQKIEGTITKETSASIEIDAKIGGIRSTMTLPRRDIQTIEKKDLPEGFFATPAAEPKPAKTAAPKTQEPKTPTAVQPAKERYAIIPLRGVFGEDFDAEYVEAAIKDAERRKAPNIVLLLDSTGGLVAEATKIGEVLDKYSDKYKYTCVIEHAGSASLWVLVRSDRVFVEETAVAGAAVVFNRAQSTGEVNVDAKLNSFIAASLAAQAEVHNVFSPVLVKAMILRESEVWVAKAEGENAKAAFFESMSAAGRNAECIDTKDAILTLKASQMLEYGIARPAAELEFGDASRYALAVDYTKTLAADAAKAMKQAKSQAKAVRELTAELQVQIKLNNVKECSTLIGKIEAGLGAMGSPRAQTALEREGINQEDLRNSLKVLKNTIKSLK